MPRGILKCTSVPGNIAKTMPLIISTMGSEADDRGARKSRSWLHLPRGAESTQRKANDGHCCTSRETAPRARYSGNSHAAVFVPKWAALRAVNMTSAHLGPRRSGLGKKPGERKIPTDLPPAIAVRRAHRVLCGEPLDEDPELARRAEVVHDALLQSPVVVLLEATIQEHIHLPCTSQSGPGSAARVSGKTNPGGVRRINLVLEKLLSRGICILKQLRSRRISILKQLMIKRKSIFWSSL